MARTLTITETNINWVHPGLSHNTANLVCGVGTAIALRATTLRMRPFWDPPALTGCKRAARVQFERLYAFDELEERFGLTVETLPWDANSRVPAYAISESRKNGLCPGASVVERAIENRSAWNVWYHDVPPRSSTNNFYRSCVCKRTERLLAERNLSQLDVLPFSNGFEAAVARILAYIGTNYTSIHVRQGDKLVAENSNLRLPIVHARFLYAAACASTAPRGRLFVSTDAPELVSLQSVNNWTKRLLVEFDVWTMLKFSDLLTGTPFAMGDCRPSLAFAVEMMVHAQASRFLATENSGVGALINVYREQLNRRGAAADVHARGLLLGSIRADAGVQRWVAQPTTPATSCPTAQTHSTEATRAHWRAMQTCLASETALRTPMNVSLQAKRCGERGAAFAEFFKSIF